MRYREVNLIESLFPRRFLNLNSLFRDRGRLERRTLNWPLTRASRGIRGLARHSEFADRLTRYLIKRVEWLALLKGGSVRAGRKERRKKKEWYVRRRVISVSAAGNGTYYLLCGDTATTFKNVPMCSACIEKGSAR